MLGGHIGYGPHTCLAWRMLRSKIDNNTIFLYLPNLSLRIEHLVSKSLYALVVALLVLEEGFETDLGTSGVFVTSLQASLVELEKRNCRLLQIQETGPLDSLLYNV